MSAAIEIIRDGDEWIIEDGSAHTRLSKPGARVIERLVKRWEREVDGCKKRSFGPPSVRQ